MTNNIYFALNDLYTETREPNWDGYGAEPIPDAAFKEATKLVKLLPLSLPRPVPLGEPDGSIGLEWYVDKYLVFIVSVNGTNTIDWAVFLKKGKVWGTECFDGIMPDVIIDSLHRLYPEDIDPFKNVTFKCYNFEK